VHPPARGDRAGGRELRYRQTIMPRAGGSAASAMSGTHSNLCPIMSRQVQVQLGLKLPRTRTHGGARRGAGRKPRGARPGVSHRRRDHVARQPPVHVTMRVLDHVWNLRSRRCHAVVQAALAGMLDRREFRVVHYSVQGNHVHLIVEADDRRALSEGIQGFSVRLAKGLNRLMRRRGKVFADRFHEHVLRTPSETRRALAYVLLNHSSHMARIGKGAGQATVDPFSSGAAFDGWREPVAPGPGAPVWKAPETWLLRSGWRRQGLLETSETPQGSS
jgi:REP element-mobilizing transposase RayT